jgi:hypothetical protein
LGSLHRAGTHGLQREQIKLQVALITPLMHVKGYAAAETRANAAYRIPFYTLCGNQAAAAAHA